MQFRPNMFHNVHRTIQDTEQNGELSAKKIEMCLSN